MEREFFSRSGRAELTAIDRKAVDRFDQLTRIIQGRENL
jgi:hypothetical protein